MPVHNADIARIFEEIADLLEIQGENPFRIRAYRTAARTIFELGQDIPAFLAAGGDLDSLPGIGRDLEEKIKEIAQTGHSTLLEKLYTEVPPALTELLKIPGLGPKRVHALHTELDIRTTEQLQRAALDGRIRELRGFGEKTERHILDTIATPGKREGRLKLAAAQQYATALEDYLRQLSGVGHVVTTGSFRRSKETVGDLDILVTAGNGRAVIERFVLYDDVREVISKGTTRATVVLQAGLQVDLRVVAERSFGAALHYFTGSKAHNVAVRRLAQQRGLKINEYGVFKDGEYVAGQTEESVFAAVGLPFIPAELREDRGEIEAAREGRLPRLVTLEDIQGDLHAHTRATDGRNTLEEMAAAAQRRGLKYLAITEHSMRITMAHGLDETRLRAQNEAIDRLNTKLHGITLIKGIEVDILEDGKLDLPDSVLGTLDLVVAAIHSRFNLSRAAQTARILRAMERPHLSILAHPSGRLLQEREPYDVDMARVIRAARERGCFLELNAHPERLDLLDTYCRMAKDAGVYISINSDAHSVLDLQNLRYGVGQARRGWLERGDVLNTRPLKELMPLLRRTMSR